jgi:hypothetical protein
VTCGERTGGGRGSRATRTDWRQLSGAGRPLRADYHQGSGEWCSGQRQMSWSNSLLRVCLCLLGLGVPVYTTKILLVVYSNIDALRTAGVLKSKMCLRLCFFDCAVGAGATATIWHVQWRMHDAG